MVLGLVVMAAVAAATGAVNGSLIRFAKFTPVAATLATYIALQGLSFLLRDAPGGNIAFAVTGLIKTTIGPVPVVFVLLVVVAVVMEYVLRRRRVGLRLRAVGSDEESARRVGVNVDRTVILGYVAGSIFVFLGVDRAARAARHRRPGPGHRLHAEQHHRRGARRHQPAGRARHLRRHPARRRPDRPGPQRDGLPRPLPGLAVLLPGRADRGRRRHLQPGARHALARTALATTPSPTEAPRRHPCVQPASTASPTSASRTSPSRS